MAKAIIRYPARQQATEISASLVKDINIKIGKVEEKAIYERNPVIHGFKKHMKKIHTSKHTYNIKSYYTLLMRVILKILGYNGQYIDRSNKSNNFLVSSVEQKLTGYNGDSKPL